MSDLLVVGLAERLLAKVERTSSEACWEFTGSRDDLGYGMLRVDGRTRRAHRVAWELEHGPIASGLVVCHHCDNPPCCNVAHLFVGTVADNNADRSAKGRSSGGPGRAPGPLVHGSLQGYKRGCRCDECREVRNAATRRSRARRSERARVIAGSERP